VTDEQKRRASLLYCMDYIMRALDDEEAISGWLANGVPDGTFEDKNELTDEQVKDFADLEVDQCDFDEMVAEFVSTLFVETFPKAYRTMRKNGVSFTPHDTGVIT